jgi:integrase
MQRKAGRWSFITGEKGRNRVRVFAHPDTGRLFLELRENGAKRDSSLGHRDREAAKLKAEEIAAALRRPDPRLPADITLGALFDNYLREVTPTKGVRKQAHDRRASTMMLNIIGSARRLSTISHRDAARFVAERRRQGDQRPGKTFGQPLRARMIDYDMELLQAALNWAVTAGWIDRNPLKGFRVEREENTQRPIIAAPQYEALLSTSSQISPLFRLALIVTHETGHRIGAVRLLCWSDIDVEAQEVRWRAENDKRKFEHVTPLSATALEALREARRTRASIGDGWVFPSPADPAKPISRHLVRDWWQRGEALAELPPEPRRGWHSLRRKFATEMKHAPLKDLCALGGWKDHQTILKCYQRADPITMKAALATRLRLEA